MSAVATATPVQTLLELIGDNTLLLDDVAEQVPAAVLSQAWAGGLIEFGRAKHVVTGRPGAAISKPTMRFESGDEWTGPKRATHKRYVDLMAETALPKGVDRFQKYEAKTDAEGQPYLVPVDITEADALELSRFRVRLTDKGLAHVGHVAS